MIDPAEDLAAIFDGQDFAPATGTVNGEAFTRGLLTGRRVEGAGGDHEAELAELVLVADDLAAAPAREVPVVFDGETEDQAWRVLSVTEIGVNGAAAGWHMKLRRESDRVRS